MSEDWMSVWVVLPPDEATRLIDHLKAEHGFSLTETDFCESERADDFAFYSYGPIGRPEGSRYG